MKLRKNKKILTMLIVICMSLLTVGVSAVQAREAVNRNGQGYPKNFEISDTPYFCIFHGHPVKVIYDGSKKDSELLNMDKATDDEIEPSVGYAYYWMHQHGKNLTDQSYRDAMQQIIWSSTQWGNTSNVLVPGSQTVTTAEAEAAGETFSLTTGSFAGNSDSAAAMKSRSYQYGTVYYGIINELRKNGHKDLFTVEKGNNSDDLKIIVDQKDTRFGSAGTYTVGPYTLKAKYGSDKGKKYLYNELVKKNNCYDKDCMQ